MALKHRTSERVLSEDFTYHLLSSLFEEDFFTDLGPSAKKGCETTTAWLCTEKRQNDKKKEERFWRIHQDLQSLGIVQTLSRNDSSMVMYRKKDTKKERLYSRFVIRTCL